MTGVVHWPASGPAFGAGFAYAARCEPNGKNQGREEVATYRTTTVRDRVTCKRCLRLLER